MLRECTYLKRTMEVERLGADRIIGETHDWRPRAHPKVYKSANTPGVRCYDTYSFRAQRRTLRSHLRKSVTDELFLFLASIDN